RLRYRVLAQSDVLPPTFRFDVPPGRATPQSPATLLEIELLTGRFHQIRFQLAAAGCPILGDVKYGAPARLRRQKVGLEAVELTFEHPVRREPVTLTGDYHLAGRFRTEEDQPG